MVANHATVSTVSCLILRWGTIALLRREVSVAWFIFAERWVCVASFVMTGYKLRVNPRSQSLLLFSGNKSCILLGFTKTSITLSKIGIMSSYSNSRHIAITTFSLVNLRSKEEDWKHYLVYPKQTVGKSICAFVWTTLVEINKLELVLITLYLVFTIY